MPKSFAAIEGANSVVVRGGNNQVEIVCTINGASQNFTIIDSGEKLQLARAVNAGKDAKS